MRNDPAKTQPQPISRKHDNVVDINQIIMTSKHISVFFKINKIFRFSQFCNMHKEIQLNCVINCRNETRHSTLQKKCKYQGISSVPWADCLHIKHKWHKTDQRI